MALPENRFKFSPDIVTTDGGQIVCAIAPEEFAEFYRHCADFPDAAMDHALAASVPARWPVSVTTEDSLEAEIFRSALED